MEWSYVAGFFDGEGCVNIGLSTRRNKTRRNWYPVARCTITNTNKLILEAIQTEFAVGTIHMLCRQRPTQKPAYSLCITKHSDVIKFIDGVYPYIIIKRKQLELLKEAVIFILNNDRKKWSKSKIIKYNRIFITENAKINHSNHGRKRILERVFDG